MSVTISPYDRVLTAKQKSLPLRLGQSVPVTVTTAGNSVVSSNNNIRSITITNLDTVNTCRLSVGNAITSTIQGDGLPPNASAFYSQSLGDQPWRGIWGIAKTAAVTLWVTVGFGQ